MPYGGPDGGRGGPGGSVRLVGRRNLAGFAHLGGRRVLEAKPGTAGSGYGRDGATGEDLLVPVPLGTVATDETSGEILGEVVGEEETLLAAKGGRGGLGNRDLANAKRRAPKIAQGGEEGVERRLRLEVRLLADVGLVGKPNAGKSSLLARVSRARPKIANYPFTTIEPVLGTLAHDDVTFVMADLPGLIEGAADGKGLGHKFLRHLFRNRVLLFLADGTSEDPSGDLKVLERELSAYNKDLAKRPRFLALNKIDLLDPISRKSLAKRFARSKRWRKVFLISAATGEGTQALVAALAGAVAALPPAPRVAAVLRPHVDTPGRVIRDGGAWRIEDEAILRYLDRWPVTHRDTLPRFWRLIERRGLAKALAASGAVPGDAVLVGDLEFEYRPVES